MAVYDFPNALTIGYDVVSNRPKVAAYRAPGAPIGTFALESAVDELARELGIDPLRMREINGARDGVRSTHGVTWANIGYQQTLAAARASAHMKVALEAQPGTRHRLGPMAQRRAANRAPRCGRQRRRHGHRHRGSSRYRRLARSRWR